MPRSLRPLLAALLVLPPWSIALAGESGKAPAGLQARLAAGLLATLAKTETAANVVVSPATFAAALNTLALGASEADRAAITAPLGLGLSSEGKAPAHVGPGASITMAVRLVFDKDLPLAPQAGALLDRHGIDHGVTDLDGPSSVDQINGWVAEKTKGAIRSIVDSPPGGGFVSLGAIHFKASWQSSFLKPSSPAAFRRADGSAVQVPMMHLTAADRLFRADQRFAAVELAYADPAYRMIVVASRDHAGIAPTDLPALAPWLAGEGFEVRRGEVSLPRFAIKDGHDLIDALRGTGLSPERLKLATYPGFTPERIHLDRILQKTAIEVDEDGTEAAAATAAIAERSIEANFVSVTADSRFAFALRDARTGLVLVAGLVGDPLSSGH